MLTFFHTWHLIFSSPSFHLKKKKKIQWLKTWEGRNPQGSFSDYFFRHLFWFDLGSNRRLRNRAHFSLSLCLFILEKQAVLIQKQASAFLSGVVGQRPQSNHCCRSFFSAEHAIAVGGCHRAWLSHFHTLFTAHYYLSITCNYPSWWLMECFRGWVGKQLGLSCWGLYIITQSLNTAQYEDNLRGATRQWLGCCVRTSGLWSSQSSSRYVASEKVTPGQMFEQWLLHPWDWLTNAFLRVLEISDTAILLSGYCLVGPFTLDWKPTNTYEHLAFIFSEKVYMTLDYSGIYKLQFWWAVMETVIFTPFLAQFYDVRYSEGCWRVILELKHWVRYIQSAMSLKERLA